MAVKVSRSTVRGKPVYVVCINDVPSPVAYLGTANGLRDAMDEGRQIAEHLHEQFLGLVSDQGSGDRIENQRRYDDAYDPTSDVREGRPAAGV